MVRSIKQQKKSDLILKMSHLLIGMDVVKKFLRFRFISISASVLYSAGGVQ
jgi:hypothetical protein